MHQPCVIIPVYNHEHAIGIVVAAVRQLGLPVILVDDGSHAACAQVLDQLARQDGVSLVRLPQNGGKGAAMLAGFRHAAAAGFSHALQIDADGQHDTHDIPAFIAASLAHPDAVIAGYPIYDDSVPKARLIGRYATHIWVWINTLSLRIKDSMCGFRLYPLGATMQLIQRCKIGQRMSYDTDILVRLDWQGVPIVNLPCHVHYPLDGVSHFQVWHDNVRISAMHTRLFFGMLPRLPKLIWRHLKPTSRSTHWARISEVGFSAGIRFMYQVHRYLGRWPFLLILDPILAWYVLSHPVARRASQEYLARLHAHSCGATPKPSLMNTLRHFGAFAEMMVDKLLAWSGQPLPDETQFSISTSAQSEATLNASRGCVINTAHIGNPELFRLLAKDYRQLRLNVLVHTANAEQFNRLMREINPHSQMNLIQVTTISPATAILLAEKIEQGEHVVIAGDRVPVNNPNDLLSVDFLGQAAYLPFGPYLLASILKCPLLGMVASQRSKSLHLTIELIAEQVQLPRKNRHAAAQPLAQHFADLLARECQAAPLQWFNFYPFWNKPSL